MDSTEKKVLTIGYGGTLGYFSGDYPKYPLLSRLKTFFWNYRVNNVDYSTRSGYYLFSAIRELKLNNPELACCLNIRFWGSINIKNKEQVKNFGIDEIVKIEGYKEKRESLKLLEKSDILLLPLEIPRNGNEHLFIPGKLYEYLQMGKPVLVLGKPCDSVNILRRSGLGIIVDPHDRKSIIRTLTDLIEKKCSIHSEYSPDWEYIYSNFHFQNLTKKFIDIFLEK